MSIVFFINRDVNESTKTKKDSFQDVESYYE